MLAKDLDRAAIDARITFHDDDQIMEVSFADLTLSTSTDVNAFYDRVEERIDETGEPLWFFLINYCNSRIDPDAWFAFSRRGKALNTAHSMASVRFDASEITRRQIERDAGTANFDPNLFYDRDAAIQMLRSLPTKRRARQTMRPTITPADAAKRIKFLPDQDIMEVDLSGVSFEHALDVDTVYDVFEEKIEKTGRRWYFLVNYDGTRIQSPAWVRYAARGKTVNEQFALGSVRYAPGSETETDIRMRAESQGFRPNIRNTRAEAIARIDEMKAEARELA
ncbi:MAG: hypothetical protein AAGP08_04910 [Pseudomonadota bacterium]